MRDHEKVNTTQNVRLVVPKQSVQRYVAGIPIQERSLRGATESLSAEDTWRDFALKSEKVIGSEKDYRQNFYGRLRGTV